MRSSFLVNFNLLLSSFSTFTCHYFNTLFIRVSTYVLLTLVWAECFLESRLHTQNSTSFRKQFLIFFMVFNTALYVTQITLYACIFLAPFAQNKVVRNIIYVGITGINFTAVVLVLIFFVYLNVRFSVSSIAFCDLA